jgi:hypothetical protein
VGKVSTLSSLNLLQSSSITTIGWRDIAGASYQHLTLKELRIGSDDEVVNGNVITFNADGHVVKEGDITTVGDDLIISFADALAGNTSLEFFEFQRFSVSGRGWSVLVNALCDTMSIDSTYTSNHTLCRLMTRSYPFKLADLMEMNNNENKADVAREKIIMHHFADEGTCVRIFGPMQVQI